MKQGKTHSIGISAVLFLAIALLLYHLYTKSNAADPSFRWISGNPGDRSVQVETGKTLVVPFIFRISDEIAETVLSIRDESWLKKGVLLKDPIVPVRNGIASSQVIFNFQPEAGIESGHYTLMVVARDAATGNIVHEGNIPFIVDMLDLIWKCSC